MTKKKYWNSTYVKDLKYIIITYGTNETSCVFIFLCLWHKEFHKYRMQWKFISDIFYHMLNSQKTWQFKVSRGLSSKSILAWWHVDKFDFPWCRAFWHKNIRLENDKVRQYVDLCAFSWKTIYNIDPNLFLI